MSASDQLTVFVNERRVQVPLPATALSAVRAADPALVDALHAGRAYLTDGRGVPCPTDLALAPGAILRVVMSARRARESDAHA
jgi:hypothetical protein